MAIGTIQDFIASLEVTIPKTIQDFPIHVIKIHGMFRSTTITDKDYLKIVTIANTVTMSDFQIDNVIA